MRLLLAEDEKMLSDALVTMLTHNNYSVDAVYNGQDALDYLETGDYDGAILDIMMPKMDGLTVLRKIREEGLTLPVIMLTAKSEVDDRVEGLDAGADDYITKPFAIEELLARIRVAERHHEGDEKPRGARIEIGPVALDEDRHEVTVNGEPVYLTNHEFLLLQALMENKNIVMDRARLIEKVCGYDYVGETNVIDVYVRYLRTKIDDRYGINLIRTVRGVGYVIREDLDQK